MTSSVKIDAHCGKDKEVIVIIYNGMGLTDNYTLQDGESKIYYIYDAKSIETFERFKDELV